MVCALNKFSAAKLSGKIYKEYLAVAGGEFYGDGVIDKPIIRPDPMKTLRDVGVGGERARYTLEIVKGKGRLYAFENTSRNGQNSSDTCSF